MSDGEDFFFAVKPSIRQWQEYLSPMPQGRRSAYIREAILAYMHEVPVLCSIPVHEDPNEPTKASPIRFVVDEAIANWFSPLPTQIRSYVIRYILNWYRPRFLAKTQGQQTFKLDALPPTGTAPDGK